VQLALDTATLLRPEDNTEDRALWGLLELAVALSYAKLGQDGNAWHYWDQAHAAARALTDGYVHPYLLFGIGMVEAYAITMHTDLMRGREATPPPGAASICWKRHGPTSCDGNIWLPCICCAAPMTSRRTRCASTSLPALPSWSWDNAAALPSGQTLTTSPAS
jgi:hypothetical protein